MIASRVISGVIATEIDKWIAVPTEARERMKAEVLARIASDPKIKAIDEEFAAGLNVLIEKTLAENEIHREQS